MTDGIETTPSLGAGDLTTSRATSRWSVEVLPCAHGSRGACEALRRNGAPGPDGIAPTEGAWTVSRRVPLISTILASALPEARVKPVPRPPSPGLPPSRLNRYDVVGIGWVALVAVITFLPALVHGIAFGPYRDLGTYGLTHRPGLSVGNTLTSDQVTQMIPWVTLAWHQVHAGHLPLWNPYSALGTPLAFNWQSSAFSVPALLSYAFPVTSAYAVQVIVTTVIAGSGAYVLSRTLRLGPVPAALAGVGFELSGPFFGWTGWPIASVLAWSGWILAAVVVTLDGRYRVRGVACIALSAACAVYAGQPDALVLLGMTAAVFSIVLVALHARREGIRGATRPIVDIALGVVIGGCLSAPLLLPGAQLVTGSVRSRGGGALLGEQAASAHELLTIFVGFDGIPIELYASLGAVVVVLAAVGLVARRRDPRVVPLIATGVVAALLAASPAAISLAGKLPGLHAVRWPRALTVLVFVVAILAAAGAEELAARWRDRRVTAATTAGFAVLVGGIAVLAAVRPAIPALVRTVLSDVPASFASHALFTELVDAGIGFVAVIGLVLMSTPKRARHLNRTAAQGPSPRHDAASLVGARASRLAFSTASVTGADGRSHGPGSRQAVPQVAFPSNAGVPRTEDTRLSARLRKRPGLVVAIILLMAESAFLIVQAGPVWSSSPAPPAPNAAESALARIVGSQVVGLGAGTCLGTPGLGILPDTNSMVGVHELAVYDPMLTRRYFAAWKAATGQPGGEPQISTFCPAVTSAALARRFGVGYVLTAHGAAAPTGTVFVTTLGTGVAAEDLYRVPGAGAATVVGAHSIADGGTAVGTPVAVMEPNPSTWRIVTDATHPELLHLHLTDVPGWRATIDGRPLPLRTYDDVMLEASVPAGRHTVVVTYWPKTFTVGILLAVLAAAALVIAVGVDVRRRRRVEERGPASAAPSRL